MSQIVDWIGHEAQARMQSWSTMAILIRIIKHYAVRQHFRLRLKALAKLLPALQSWAKQA
jgi:hypothetical protein